MAVLCVMEEARSRSVAGFCSEALVFGVWDFSVLFVALCVWPFLVSLLSACVLSLCDAAPVPWWRYFIHSPVFLSKA